MKHRKLFAVLSAAVLFGASVLPATAADDVMTVRMAADTTTVYTDQLNTADVYINGGIYIDHYTGLTSIRMILKSDSPLTIVDGCFTPDPVKKNPQGEPLDAMFNKHDSTFYEQTTISGETNVVLWNAYGINVTDPPAVGVQDNPDTTFVSYRICVPKGTPAGDYKCYISTEIKLNEIGQKDPDFYAFHGWDDYIVGEDIILQPVVISVRDKVTTTTAPPTTPTTTTTTSTTTSTTATSTTTTVTTVPAPPIHGDFNGDNSYDIADAVLLLRWISEDTTIPQDKLPTEKLLKNADLDQDGTVTMLDATLMLWDIRMTNGWYFVSEPLP